MGRSAFLQSSQQIYTEKVRTSGNLIRDACVDAHSEVESELSEKTVFCTHCAERWIALARSNCLQFFQQVYTEYMSEKLKTSANLIRDACVDAHSELESDCSE